MSLPLRGKVQSTTSKMLLNALGKGRVLTFAGSPDVATSGGRRIVEARKFLSNAVRTLHRRPRLRIQAQAFVEVVATDDPASRQYHVHLIALRTRTDVHTPEQKRGRG